MEKDLVWIPTENKDENELLKIRSMFYRQIQEFKNIIDDLQDALRKLNQKTDNTFEIKHARRQCREAILRAEKEVLQIEGHIVGINLKLEEKDYS